MTWIVNYARSSVGMKHITGLTGLAMVGFLFVHMAGNLLLFGGPDAINAYAVKLRDLGPLLWIARLGLLAVFVAHTLAAFRLMGINKEARPVRYHHDPKMSRTPFYARYMPMTGIVLLAFVVFHLAHLTFHVVLPDNAVFTDEAGRFDVYSMTVLGFQNVVVAGSYIVAMFLLSLHLAHGIPSFFQSLGVTHPKYKPFIERVGLALAGLLFIGNVAMPAAAFAGILELPAWAVAG
jgi:succinate dehydrogenase / fumarate reductase cytochrome b subunit